MFTAIETTAYRNGKQFLTVIKKTFALLSRLGRLGRNRHRQAPSAPSPRQTGNRQSSPETATPASAVIPPAVKRTPADRGRDQVRRPPPPPPSSNRKPAATPFAVEDFAGISLERRIVQAVTELGFTAWTEVQRETMPPALAGRDVAAQAQTGTGKTATFLITILSHLLKNGPDQPSALILAPTRELAIQIDKDLRSLAGHCRISHLAVYGGQDYEAQKSRLKQGVDVITATPGRLIDFSRKKIIDLSRISILVLDEADRMLDMGFLPDIRRIISLLPERGQRQNMLFSATLDPHIMRLANQWMNDPLRVEIMPDQMVAKEVSHYAYAVSKSDKLPLLLWLLNHQAGDRVLVFRNRRATAEELARTLIHYGINCALLSGEVQQSKRMRVLEAFRQGGIRVIVATDVAGRGIHVDNISHVINYDIPDEEEAYIHRIGRTGRAGIPGRAISFACEEGGFMIPDIEAYLGEPIRMLHPSEEMLQSPHPVRHVGGRRKTESLTGHPAGKGKKKPRGQSQKNRPRRRPNR